MEEVVKQKVLQGRAEAQRKLNESIVKMSAYHHQRMAARRAVQGGEQVRQGLERRAGEGGRMADCGNGVTQGSQGGGPGVAGPSGGGGAGPQVC